MRQSSRRTSHATRYHRRPVGHELERLDQPTRVVAVASAVVEAHLLTIAARQREHCERVGVDGRSAVAPLQRRDVGVHRVHPPAQAVGQHLLELGERAHRGVLHALDRRARGRPQADRDRDRFLVVEQERREVRARAPAGSRRPAPGVASTG